MTIRGGGPRALATSNEHECELLRRVSAHDRLALRELYLAYHRRLSRFLMRMTGRHDLIEEIVNDTLWTVWRKAADFRGDSLVSTWIVGICYRRALRALRRIPPAGVPCDAQWSAEDTTLIDEDRQWLERAIMRLPTKQRATLELSYQLEYSCEEIAQIMRCPLNTVKSRLFHARLKLRRLLPQLDGSLNTLE